MRNFSHSCEAYESPLQSTPMPRGGTSTDPISCPSHYVEGRKIEPISVIEGFGLCHHLACVVKYIARAGRKTSLLNDLKKAEWYLGRELSRHQAGMAACVPLLDKEPLFTIPEILEDWKLSPHLEKALSCILHYRQPNLPHQKSRWVVKFSFSTKKFEGFCTELPLSKAMEHLRLEVSKHEEEQVNEQL